MAGDDGKGYDKDMADLISAGFPVGNGVPDGLNKTADWSSMGVPDSGVPDGLTRTADWTGLDTSFPVGSGVPDGIDKTADWTGISDSAPAMALPGQGDVKVPEASPLGILRAQSLAQVIETARTRKGVDAKVDFDSLPSISSVPTRSGATADSNKTQDWTVDDLAPALDGFPLGSGAPAGSNKTQDWTSMGQLTGADVPNKNPLATQDWSFDLDE